MQVNRQTTMTSPLERFFAILGAVYCLSITIIFWLSLSPYQTMWLLPGLYFIEIVALSILSAFLVIRADSRAWFVIWGAAGAITAFAILGSLSVGFFYSPVALIFTVIAVTSDVRNKQPMAAHVGMFFAAGIAQSALMLAAIRLLH